MKLRIIEEIFNSITHGIGLIAAIVGLILFIIFQSRMSDVWRIVGFSIFCGGLICMYLFSTLSHSFVFTKAQKVFAVLDHSSIFLFIAATYSYFLLTSLRGIMGWILLSFMWILCIGGIVMKTFFVDRFHRITVGMYLAMGWMIIFFTRPLLSTLHTPTILLLLSGGIIYSLGTIFYLFRKIPFMHVVWHMFVIGATFCHFTAIYLL